MECGVDFEINPHAHLADRYVGLLVAIGSWEGLHFLILEPVGGVRAGFLNMPEHEWEWGVQATKGTVTLIQPMGLLLTEDARFAIATTHFRKTASGIPEEKENNAKGRALTVSTPGE